MKAHSVSSRRTKHHVMLPSALMCGPDKPRYSHGATAPHADVPMLLLMTPCIYTYILKGLARARWDLVKDRAPEDPERLFVVSKHVADRITLSNRASAREH